MPRKKPRTEGAKKDAELLEEAFLSTDGVASGTECTGLVPNTPEDEAQMESYRSLYQIPTKVKGSKQGKNKSVQ